MKKRERLDRKIVRLFRSAGHPRWAHRMGPKKFETWVLCLGLVVKQVYQLSYRRAAKFLDEFYRMKLHWTTLQKAAKRLPKALWQSLLAATIEVDSVAIAAGDGTGFARSGPSTYYLRRIDREKPVGRPIQAITLVDVKQRKFLAGNFFAKPYHEAQRIPALHRQSPAEIGILLLDKGFDAEWLHQWLNKNGTFSIAPVRKGCRRGRHRKIMRDCMDWTLYWQRNIVESLFSALKRLFGSTVKTKHIRTQTAELFCRLIAYNIGYSLRRFSTKPLSSGLLLRKTFIKRFLLPRRRAGVIQPG
jgi:transposase